MALLLSFVMLLTMVPVTVLAEGTAGGTAGGAVTEEHVLNIGYGDITITKDGFTYYVADDTDMQSYTWKENEEHKLTITGSTGNDVKQAAEKNNRIIIENGDPEVTLDGVAIKAYKHDGNGLSPANGALNSRPGIWLKSGTATLVLQGDNVVQGSYFRPGIYVSSGTTLTIEGDGTLTTRGGGQHAGIGGQGRNGMGTVIVKSGTLNFPDDPNAGGYGMTTAFGGQNKGSAGTALCGTIIVEGGTVNIPKGDVTAETFTMSGGVLVASKGLVASNISVTGGTLNAAVNTEKAASVSITGGNINSSYAGAIEGYALTKLYFYNEDGTRMAEAAVTVDGWTAMTDANGVITTYLENDKTTITYDNVSYNVVDHAVLIGVAQEAGALQWAAGDPPTITIDSDTTGVVSGKLDGTVKVTSGTADLTMKQEGANEWTVVAEEAVDSVVLRLDTVNGKVRFGNSGDAQYQMGYVTADKVKLNPDGGDVAVNADGTVTWGSKYTLTGIGDREIVVNGADTEAERTVVNDGGKAITVNGETLAAGESMTIRKAERCQTAEDGDATASYVLGGGHTINEFSSSVEEFKPKTRVFSHMTLEEYKALMRLNEVEEEEINALIQIGTVSGYRALVVGEGCTASLPYIKDEAGAVSDMQRLITEAFLDEDITAQGKKDRSLYNSHLISLDILHLQTVELYNLDIMDLYIGAQVTYFGRGYLRVTGSITVDPNSDSYKAEDSILFTKDGATLLYFLNTKTGSYTTPSTCVEIGTQAFNESHLSEITLGANLKTLGKSWNEGALIKVINVSAANPYFTSDEGVLYNADGTNLVLYPRFREGAEYVIPEGVTSVDTMGIYMSEHLEKLTLPSSLVKRGDYLLGRCDELKELDIRTLSITSGDISSQMLSKVTVPEGYNFAKWGLLVKCANWPIYKYLPMTWTNTLSAPKDVSVAYDGRPHAITVSSTDATVAIQYSLDGQIWSDSVQCTDPGEYTVYWKAIKLAEAEETSEDSKTDGIYGFDREVNSSVTLTITGLPVQKEWFTLESVRKADDADINTAPVTFTLPEGNIAIDGSCVAYTYDGKTELPTAAGSYLVKVAVKGATGYADTEFELGYYTILSAEDSSKVVMSFVTNGGTVIEPINGVQGTAITAPADPTRAGYTFDGWYSDVTLKSKVEAIPTAMPENSVTYYAKWTPVEYTITYNGLDGAKLSQPNPATYTIETPDFTLTNPTKPGYAFKGWQDGDAGPDAELTIRKGTTTGDKTFTAVFEQETYTITYVACAEGATTYQLGDAVTLSVPADREGYTFAGWTLTIDGRTMVQDKDELTLPTHLYGDMTVTGIWLANDQTLTFNANGGMFSEKFGGKETYVVNAKTDSAFRLPDAPARTCYTFDGWFMDESGTTAFDAAAMPASDTTVYAKWTPVEYTITYNGLEGAELSQPNPATYTIETPDFTLTNPTKPGYTFKGWQIGNAGSDAVQSVIIKKGTTGDMVFTAVFEQETYTITYVACVEGVKTYKLGDTVTLSVPADREGYTFAGWTLTIDGRTMMQDKDELTLPTDLYGDMTITGIWLANDQTLTFNANGGVFSEEFGGKETYVVKAKTDSAFQLPGTPVRPGYTFQGWFMDKSGTTAFDAAVMPASNTTVYAKWTVDAGYAAPEGVTVIGLDKVAAKVKASIRMTITAIESADSEAQSAISAMVGSSVKLSFYEMTVTADGQPLSDTNEVLVIKLPVSRTNGYTITVYRYHGGKAEKLARLNAEPNTPVDGTYFVSDGYVTIYSSKFSTYAVGTRENARHTGTAAAENSIISGADQTKRAGDIIKVAVQSGSAKVSAVYVDGVLVGSEYYIVSGNTVKLQGTYTAALAQGIHTLEIVYDNGTTATTTFTLQGTTSPRTGDAGVGIYIACVVLSMTGGAYLFRKKRSYN